MSGQTNSIRPSFSTPAEVVAFIKQCIELNEPKSLYDACSIETSDFWKDYIFQDFREIQQSETLEAVFLQNGRIASFPEEGETFKLGGHSQRTRHLHIDLEKLGEHWFIQTILKCR